MTGVHQAEHELLLQCAASRLTPERAERIRALAGSIYWDGTIELAERHGVLPLVYWSLSRVVGVEVPRPVMATLAERFRANALWSLRLAGYLVQLMTALEARQIRAVAWKGPALSMAAYGHLALRTFSDLDLLVARPDLERAGAALRAHGLRPEASLPDLRVWPFTRPDGLVVELHWAPAPWPFVSDLRTSDLHREAVAMGDHSIGHLAPADLLVVLCVHGSKHRWDRLQWIVDLAELIQARPDLDWTRARSLAAGSGTLRMLRLGLRLAQDLVGASLPAAAARMLEGDAAIAWLAPAVSRRVLHGPSGPPRGRERVWDLVLQLRLKQRLRDRLRYLAGVPAGRMWRALSAHALP